MRRELVSTTIQKFDDEPQNYRTWKSSFLNVIKDLSLSPREELDLLIKWLGPQSSEQARRVSAAQIYNVVASLEMVWQRLEESYGAPEVIEHALFKKMEDFAKISAKDNSRLRELGDLLLELELAKAEGHSPGLAFLDTARGVNPIVEKLPHTLQEKWISCASKFKTNHNVAFPPFSVFSQFVREQARIRNDPSFFFLSTGVGKAERPIRYNRTQISVRKTDVSCELGVSELDKWDDPDKQCPLHWKPHPVRKCRSFRSKSLEERKAYLKEKNICFRCCGSTKHLAKKCTAKITCKECESDKHISALHPGPPPHDFRLPLETGKHGGEPQAMPVSTSVCGDWHSPRSCAKICLALVYPSGKRERKQSNYMQY